MFYWDTLFPDRRDFMILTPFPIRLRQLVTARLFALLVFVLMMVLAVNLVPNSMVMMVSMFLGKLNGAGLRLALAQIAATCGALVFAFLGVTALQGILISLTSAKIFRRVSPWIQLLGMSAMVMSVVGFPVYSTFLKPAVEQQQAWLYLFPPAWFSGLYECLLGGPSQFLASLGILALKMTTLTMLLILVNVGARIPPPFSANTREPRMHRIGRARMEYSALVNDVVARTHTPWIRRKNVGPQPKASIPARHIFECRDIDCRFFGVRDTGGQDPLVANRRALGGFRPGLLLHLGLTRRLPISRGPRRQLALPPHGSTWTEVSRNATRKLVLAAGLIPALLLALPLEAAAWTWPIVLEHIAIQMLAAALLVEALFWNFDKVPFTCSYFPGRTSLALLAVLYVYGITGYSFNMADVESAMERSWLIAVVFFAAAIATLVVSWRRHPADATVRFDGSEPEIQSFDLT